MVSAHKDGWDGHFAFSGVVLVECAEPQVLSGTGDCVQVGLVADGLVVFLKAYYYTVNGKYLKIKKVLGVVLAATLPLPGSLRRLRVGPPCIRASAHGF